MMMCGAVSQVSNATPEVQQICDKVSIISSFSLRSLAVQRIYSSFNIEHSCKLDEVVIINLDGY